MPSKCSTGFILLYETSSNTWWKAKGISISYEGTHTHTDDYLNYSIDLCLAKHHGREVK